MNFVLNLIGGIFKVGFYTTAIVVTGASFFAYSTKPTNESLQKQIESRSYNKSDGMVANGLKKIVTKSVIGTSSIDVKDFVVVKFANVTLINGENFRFIGAFQHWFPLDK